MEQFNTFGINSTMKSNFIWPQRCFPEVMVAGRYYYYARDFSRVHVGRTNAVHLYLYRAMIKFNDDEPIEILPGDVTISPAGGSTSYSLAETSRHHCIHFLPHRRTPHIMSLPLHIRLGAKSQQAAEIFDSVSRAFMQHKLTGSDYARLSASAGLQRLLAYLAEYANSGDKKAPAGRDYSAVETLVGIIDSEYAESLDVPELARRVGMSQNYLARLFREHYGVTIPHYILTLRIEKAKELLEITDSPVGCIGQYVGLHDPHYFNKMFRRFSGVNPSAYRKIARDSA